MTAENPRQDVPKADASQGSRCELIPLLSRYKKGEKEIVETKEYQSSSLNKLDKYASYALISMQHFNDKSDLQRTTLMINSEHILAALRRVVVQHPTVPAGFDAPVEIESPFMALYHHWDGIMAYRDGLSDDTEKLHLNLLTDFMEVEIGPWRKDTLTRRQNGFVDFKTLWTIYEPGHLALIDESGYPSLGRVDKTLYDEAPNCGPYLDLHCTRTVNDGTGIFSFKSQIRILEKKHFGGETSAVITSLPAHPLVLHASSSPDLKKNLIKRGRDCSKLTGVLKQYYDGFALYLKTPPARFFSANAHEMTPTFLPCKETSRVVIDGKTFFEDYPYGKPSSRSWPAEFLEWSATHFATPDDAKFALCMPYVYGFSMQRKEWCKLFVEHVAPIAWQTDAMRSLIMSAEQKTMLQTLVSSHQFPADAREVREQKNKGLVILLQGTPGSGKTMTAEVSAEMRQTALLAISLAEVFDDRFFDDRRIKQFFHYATVWQAIVLLDEADVFLEARSSAPDARRNSLVAVFLKHLEYFSGIVILTTNRIENFDPAMKSRIHLALQYQPPTSALRHRIWTSRLSSLPSHEHALDIPRAVDALVPYDMNGREITNAINTARTLARHAQARLALEDLMTVVGVWKRFDEGWAAMKERRGEMNEKGESGERVERAIGRWSAGVLTGLAMQGFVWWLVGAKVVRR